MGNFVESSKEASKGGFQNIKTVRGLLTDISVVDPPATWKNATKQLIQFSLSDAVILERFDPEDDFALKEGKLTFTYSYAEKGKKPSGQGAYMKCLVKSAEALGKKPSDFIGKVTTFSKIPVEGFTNKETNEKVIYENAYSIIPDVSASAPATIEHIKGLVTGKNLKMALKELMMDDQAKQFPEYKESLQADAAKFAGSLGLVIVEEIFKEKK